MKRSNGAELNVLMFHGLRRSVPEYSVYAGTSTYLMLDEDFETCVNWCRRNARIVSLADLPRYLTGEATEPGILITFDDGLRSVTDLACPILAKYEASAVVFVTTGWVDGGVEPAVFRVERDLWHTTPAVFSVSRGGLKFTAQVGGRARIAAVLHELWRFCFRHRLAPLSLRPEEFAFDGQPWEPVRDLDDPEGWTPSSWDALRAGVRQGVLEVGSHGVTHIPWTWLTDEQLRNEAEMSLDRLRQQLGVEPNSFSYPHGLASPATRSVAQQVFRWSFTSQARSVRAGRAFADLLPRFHIPSERPVRVASEVRHPLFERVRRKLRSVTSR
jgi:peptidoglycan/xylan/chitin deacetylase (PgdA/CDA1 family)